LISSWPNTPAPLKQAAEKGCQHRSHVAQRLNVQIKVRFAFSPVAASLNSLFEQPYMFQSFLSAVRSLFAWNTDYRRHDACRAAHC
jgi:hypothetical protein